MKQEQSVLYINPTTSEEQHNIQFLIYEKWQHIFRSLGKMPVFEIVGDVVGGSPITEDEVLFVISKLKERGVNV